MIRLQLYHNQKWYDLDLTTNPGFVLNRQFTDIEDPTSYFAEHSKTVNIPQSKTNNEVLNKIFRVDALYFDTTHKTKFRILTSSSIIFSGVAKINCVKTKSYELQLSGEMSDTLRFLKNLTFNYDSNYKIPNPLTPNLKINRSLVKQSWDNTAPQLKLEGCRDVDIIGFTPTVHGLNESFESKQYSDGLKINDISHFIDTITNTNQGENIVGDGLNELQFMDFRSYYQKPYIYINKLWQIFQKAAQQDARCNYKLYLDSSWFNGGNPYYTDMVYMLPDMIRENISSDIENRTYAEFNEDIIYPGKPENLDTWYDIENPSVFKCAQGQEVTVDTEATFSIFASNMMGIHYNKARLDPDNGMVIQVEAVGTKSNLVLGTYKIIIVNAEKCNIDTTLYNQVLKVGEVIPGEYIFDQTINKLAAAKWTVSTKLNFNLRSSEDFKLRYRTKWANATTPFQGKDIITVGFWTNFYKAGPNRVRVSTKKINATTSKNLRSDSIIDMNRLWPSEKSIFDVLLDYCKLFNLVISVDNDHKTINILTKRRYFDNTDKILDWTDKVDMSEIEIKPVNFGCKYLQYGYSDDVEDDNLSGYNTKHEKPYGAKLLNTKYEFNNETKVIFKNIKPSADCSLNMTSLMNILSEWTDPNVPLPVYASTNIFPTNISDDKSADLWGNFYLRNNDNQKLDSQLYGSLAGESTVYISDDDNYQITHNTYCYTTDDTKLVTSSTLPLITTITKDKSKSIMFDKPDEIFCDKSFVSASTKYIYELFWNNWINERYSITNKIVKLPVYISRIDYLDFDFNKFVKIGNNLYCVNKIIDYDPTAVNQTTLVEFIQIENMEDYKVGNNIPYIDTSSNIIDYYRSSVDIEVSSSSPWMIKYSDKWITVENAQKLTHNVIITCDTWDYPNIRVGKIILKNNEGAECTIIVNQYMTGARLWINPNFYNFKPNGGTLDGYVNSSSPISVLSKPDWVKVILEPKNIIITAEKSYDNYSRQGIVRIKNTQNIECDVKVYQQGNLENSHETRVDIKRNKPSTVILNSRSKIVGITPIKKLYTKSVDVSPITLDIPTGETGKVDAQNSIMYNADTDGNFGKPFVTIPVNIINKICDFGGLSIQILFEDNTFQNIVFVYKPEPQP